MNHCSALRTQLNRFARDQAGGPAIELALTAPILAMLIVGVFTIGLEVNARIEAREAVRAGAHAVMSGEEDASVVRQIVLSALDGGQEGYVVEVTRSFRCGIDVVSLSGICSNGVLAQEYYTIELKAAAGAAYGDSPPIQARMEVRVA